MQARATGIFWVGGEEKRGEGGGEGAGGREGAEGLHGAGRDGAPVPRGRGREAEAQSSRRAARLAAQIVRDVGA